MPPRARIVLLAALIPPACGCQAFAPIAYYLRPPQIQKAEYTFPAQARVALVIDMTSADQEQPVFNQALFDKVVEYFSSYKSDAELIPSRKVTDLRRANHDYSEWSIQHIGQALEADFVLYLRVESLVTLEAPNHPILAPQVTLRAKVVAVDHPSADARVWPAEAEGREMTCKRQPSESGDAEHNDAQIAKLGTDTAYYVMMPFFDVDLEDKTPVER